VATFTTPADVNATPSVMAVMNATAPFPLPHGLFAFEVRAQVGLDEPQVVVHESALGLVAAHADGPRGQVLDCPLFVLIF
jgi:hypothetical protein